MHIRLRSSPSPRVPTRCCQAPVRVGPSGPSTRARRSRGGASPEPDWPAGMLLAALARLGSAPPCPGKPARLVAPRSASPRRARRRGRRSAASRRAWTTSPGRTFVASIGTAGLMTLSSSELQPDSRAGSEACESYYTSSGHCNSIFYPLAKVETCFYPRSTRSGRYGPLQHPSTEPLPRRPLRARRRGRPPSGTPRPSPAAGTDADPDVGAPAPLQGPRGLSGSRAKRLAGTAVRRADVGAGRPPC